MNFTCFGKVENGPTLFAFFDHEKIQKCFIAPYQRRTEKSSVEKAKTMETIVRDENSEISEISKIASWNCLLTADFKSN